MSEEIKNEELVNDEEAVKDETSVENEEAVERSEEHSETTEGSSDTTEGSSDTTEGASETVEEQAPSDTPEKNGDGKGKRGKKERKKLTPEQKKKRTIKALIITGAIVLVLAIFVSGVAIGNTVGTKALIKQAKGMDPVVYNEHDQLQPYFDEEWTYFVLPDDRTEFKVLQFTDVHIGGGSFSQQQDAWAMNAVATMIRAEQPDLVVVTGDIAYPVPFQAGTFNNLNATKIFANMMEKLGVYWTFAFGNHDTEAYSMYSRREISEYYEKQNFKYCLYERGFADEDDDFSHIDRGFGNHIINVKNEEGEYIQSLVILDSHSYIDGDYFGIVWKYDNIHQSQVDWYTQEMDKLKAKNKENGFADEYVKNMAFFHIPLVEYRNVWKAFLDQNGKDTKDPFEKGLLADVPEYTEEDGSVRKAAQAKYFYGVRGESQSNKNGVANYGVFCGYHDDRFFEEGITHGLKGVFCGHDHYNNFSIEYMGVRLTYGMSIDYLAYVSVKDHAQRGCTYISIDKDGVFDCAPKNYYSDYNVKYEKE